MFRFYLSYFLLLYLVIIFIFYLYIYIFVFLFIVFILFVFFSFVYWAQNPFFLALKVGPSQPSRRPTVASRDLGLLAFPSPPAWARAPGLLAIPSFPSARVPRPVLLHPLPHAFPREEGQPTALLGWLFFPSSVEAIPGDSKPVFSFLLAHVERPLASLHVPAHAHLLFQFVFPAQAEAMPCRIAPHAPRQASLHTMQPTWSAAPITQQFKAHFQDKEEETHKPAEASSLHATHQLVMINIWL